MKLYYVYVLASVRRTLYIGITNNLDKRLAWHRSGVNAMSFTSQYRVYRLVYFETYTRVADAIAREKQLKKWRRGKKIRLIETSNPRWSDLAPPAPPDPSPRSG